MYSAACSSADKADAMAALLAALLAADKCVLRLALLLSWTCGC